MVARVQLPAPQFEATVVTDGMFETTKLDDFLGKVSSSAQDCDPRQVTDSTSSPLVHSGSFCSVSLVPYQPGPVAVLGRELLPLEGWVPLHSLRAARPGKGMSNFRSHTHAISLSLSPTHS